MRGFRHWLSTPLRHRSITLSGIGYHEKMLPGLVDRPAGTRDILIMLFHSPAQIGTDIYAKKYPKDHIMVWSEKTGHYYGNEIHHWDHTWIHCSGPAIHQVLNRTRLPIDRPTHLSNPMIAEQAVLALHEEIYLQPAPDPTIVTNTLDSLIRRIAREVSPANMSSHTTPPAMLCVRHHIDTHFEQPIQLEDLAILADMSISHLAAEFRRCYSLPPIEYLIRQRMSRAAYLLQDRNLSVTEVSQRVGYQDPFHFSKLFKKHHAQSPKHYRATIKH